MGVGFRSIPYTNLYGILGWDEDVQEDFQIFGKSRAVRTILCNWEDRTTLLNNLGGWSGYNLQNQYEFHQMVPYPAAPGLLFFNGAKVKGIGAPKHVTNYTFGGNMVGYPWARIELNYETPPWLPWQPGTISVEYSLECIKLPHSDATGAPVWKFASGQYIANDQEIPGAELTTVTVTWKTFNNLSVPSASIMSYAAQPVNSDSFLGASAYQVKFNGAHSDRRVNTAGYLVYDTSYVLIYNPKGWNSIYNPATGNWEIVTDQYGNMPFGAGSSFSSGSAPWAGISF